MNRKELITEVYEGLSQSEPKYTIEAIIKMVEATVIDALKRGEPVELKGFGKFSVSKRAARTGRNPATGENIQIPPTVVPTFKFGKPIKDAVKNS